MPSHKADCSFVAPPDISPFAFALFNLAFTATSRVVLTLLLCLHPFPTRIISQFPAARAALKRLHFDDIIDISYPPPADFEKS